MIGRASKLCKDEKTWWRPSTEHHMKNWKVLFWMVASLLSLMEGVFSEVSKETHSDLQHFQRQPSPSFSADNLKQDSSIYTAWPEAFDWSQKEENQQGRWRRAPRTPDSARMSRRKHKKIKSSHDCHLEKKEMRVRDLGLGYDSDEIVLFKYCVGTCYSFRKNYDLALKVLTDSGSISVNNVSSHPCCRPTRYETVSFMDTQTTWQTIKWLSAANCSCIS